MGDYYHIDIMQDPAIVARHMADQGRSFPIATIIRTWERTIDGRLPSYSRHSLKIGRVNTSPPW